MVYYYFRYFFGSSWELSQVYPPLRRLAVPCGIVRYKAEIFLRIKLLSPLSISHIGILPCPCPSPKTLATASHGASQNGTEPTQRHRLSRRVVVQGIQQQPQMVLEVAFVLAQHVVQIVQLLGAVRSKFLGDRAFGDGRRGGRGAKTTRVMMFGQVLDGDWRTG